MKCLRIKYYIPYNYLDIIYYQTNNGIFEYYSDDDQKLSNVKDYISLDFLSTLSEDVFSLEEEHDDNIKWDLKFKNSYEFKVDINSVGQCGFEEIITLKDLENRRLFDLYKNKTTDDIPDFHVLVKEIKQIPAGKIPGVIYYNQKPIPYKTFLKILNDPWSIDNNIDLFFKRKHLNCMQKD